MMLNLNGMEVCSMKKCKCTHKSSWFLIDDSFDVDSKINGGAFSFDVNEEYVFYIEESIFGICYMVIHTNNQVVGFNEDKFNECFKLA